MSWPPDEPQAKEVELQCEAEVGNGGICGEIFFAYGNMIPDVDGIEFDPLDEEQTRCPKCHGSEKWFRI